jgi:hypothetical protein
MHNRLNFVCRFFECHLVLKARLQEFKFEEKLLCQQELIFTVN